MKSTAETVKEMEKKREEELEYELTNEESTFKIFCLYCNAVWDAHMTGDFEYSMGSEWTGIYGEEVHVKIHCTNCKKLIYSK